MADLDKAAATQLANISKRTGKSLEDLTAIVKKSGLAKHGELVAMLKTKLGMGHGDANMLVHVVRAADGQGSAAELPAGQMCNYKVKLTDAGDVDAELIAWINVAFTQSGG